MEDNLSSIHLTEEDFKSALKDIQTYMDITVDDLLRIYDLAMKHALVRHQETSIVKTIMTSVSLTVKPDEKLTDIYRLMAENHVSGLPVVDDSNKALGYISESDFFSAIGPAEDSGGWHILDSIIHKKPLKKKFGNTVRDIMSETIYSVNLDDSVKKAVDLMKRNNISRVLVCDSRGYFQGVLSKSDIIKCYLKGEYKE
ncbi:MAG: CBS domain-containing protein [Spirochaetota bacterium]|nr:CBS domain-containing protein [Spirochaetota bacterium]